jgi:glycosyl transferase family 2
MPYYGDQAYLLRAVESVRMLRDADWRLTIVEDAYPGGQAAEAAVRVLNDQRIRYLRNARNLGVAGNFSRSLAVSDREFVVVTDFDDIMLPNYATVVSGLLERHPRAAIVQPRVEIIDESDQPCRPLPDRVKSVIGARGREVELAGEAAVASLLRGNWLYGPALCYRRSAVARVPFRPDADSVHDLARAIAVLRQGGSLVVGAEIAYRYRRHRGSHSSTSARTGMRFEQERSYFDEMAQELERDGWLVAAREARLRLTSRLNALTWLPGAIRSRQGAAVRALLRHALG